MSAAPDLLLLAELRSAGFDVGRHDADKSRLRIAPSDKLTDSQKARITAGKTALLAALDAEGALWRNLERRIRQMAERWQYPADDLAEALQGARDNRAGWIVAIECDEGRAECASRAGLRYPSIGPLP